MWSPHSGAMVKTDGNRKQGEIMMLRYPRVLLLSNDESETSALDRLLTGHVLLTTVNNLPELVSLLENGNYDALFCAWSFHTGTWSDALEEVQKLHSDLPVIILSSSAEEREWLRVLEAGAFDLLVPPFQDRALLAVLEQASASRDALTPKRIASLSKASA
jgi:DNA-binding NtrC family response regulator